MRLDAGIADHSEGVARRTAIRIVIDDDVHGERPSAAARGLDLRFGLELRCAAGALLLVRNARAVFAATVAVGRAFAGGVERFPGDACGVVDPGFFRLGVATG